MPLYELFFGTTPMTPTDLSAETAARIAADAAEASARQAADAVLQAQIDGISVGAASFAGLTGEPEDNDALAAALAGKETAGAAAAAQAAAIQRGNHTGTQAVSTVTGLQAALDAKAPVASPALTGLPTAPTQSAADDSTKLATTAFVAAALRALVGLAPSELDTLAEIATALAANETSDAALAATVSGKAAKSANLSDLADAAAARSNLGLPALFAAKLDASAFTGPAVKALLEALSGTNRTAASAIKDLPMEIGVACSDEITALTTGTAKATFRLPRGMTLTAVRASLTEAPAGATVIADINRNGSSILSTKLSIDAAEKTSVTAASAAVISTASLSADDEITIDIGQVGSSTAGKGLKIWLIGTRA